MPNVESLLRDHVTLQVECVDRLYLNGYVPRLQRPQNLWWFFTQHRRCPVLSPQLLKKMTDAFVGSIHAFADNNDIPIVRFEKGQCKEAVAQQYARRFVADEGVVLIGIAQEQVSGFRLVQKQPQRRRRAQRSGKPPCFVAYRGKVHVNQYYFYILDRDFGLCFIKFSSYAPFGIKVWLNGHEWAKRQLLRRGIDFVALDNGLLTCDDPKALQRLCDRFGPRDIERFFERWLRRLPHPFTKEDHEAGFRYKLSILQMEVSLTQVFDRPLRGREFFEEVIRDNLDIGRPDRVQLLFERRVTRKTPGRFRTRVLTQGVQPSLRFDYKRTRVKQYFKLERALRTETTFNDTRDFGIGRSLGNLPRLKALGCHINRRLLTLERVAHNCAIASKTVERIVLPTTDDQGQRIAALRWGEPRTMALMSALCAFTAAPEGLTNRTLRPRVAALHNPDYSPSQMSYDLRRLRLNGFIAPVPRTHRYVLTPLGRRAAFFLCKSYCRIVRPALHRTDPSLPQDAPDKLRRAWHNCEREIHALITEARMSA